MSSCGMEQQVRAAARKAQRWLLESGIHILNRDDPNYGAVYSYYDPTRRRYELVYAEATGYVISLLRYLCAVNAPAGLIERAKASGDWLVRCAGQHHGIITMGRTAAGEIAAAYAFDNGICCKGLLDLYELTGHAAYLTTAERIAAWLISQAMQDDGSVKPMFDLRSGGFAPAGTSWYAASGSFHAKIAMPLLQLYTLTHDARFRGAAMKLCRWAIQQQKPDGSFPANRQMKIVNLHAHCYTIEALLYAYASEQVPEFLDAATRAAHWMVKIQQPDGSVQLWHANGSGKERTSYPQAQAVRIFSLLNMLRPQHSFTEAGQKAAQSLLRMQSSEEDTRAHGGFLEGDILKYKLFYRRSRKAISWATMFAIHALDLVERIEGGDFHREIRWLL
jgi:uncharacterized protein YyaL (SSP411 family)